VGAPADQDLDPESPRQVLPGPSLEGLGVLGGKTEDQARVHIMPANQFQDLEFIGRHAGSRVPRHQPRIGILLAGPGGRLVGQVRLAGATPAAFRAGQ
jgi:hypothetical protein